MRKYFKLESSYALFCSQQKYFIELHNYFFIFYIEQFCLHNLTMIFKEISKKKCL